MSTNVLALPVAVKACRLVGPNYPDWAEDVLHPELGVVGSTEYHLTGLDFWVHDSQKDAGVITGHPIYEHLRNKGMIKRCLDIHDGEVIRQQGANAFRQVFGNKVVPLWRSVVRRRDGSLYVPCVYVDGEQVAMFWRYMGGNFGRLSPAPMLASDEGCP